LAYMVMRRHRLMVPHYVTIAPLPPKCPELNPQEDVWQFNPDNWLSSRRLDDAKQVLQRLRKITPLINESFAYLHDSEHRNFLLSGLRLAATGTRGPSVHQLGAARCVPTAARGSSAPIASLHSNNHGVASTNLGQARKARLKSQA